MLSEPDGIENHYYPAVKPLALNTEMYIFREISWDENISFSFETHSL